MDVSKIVPVANQTSSKRATPEVAITQTENHNKEIAQEVTMSALADLMSAASSRPEPRGCDLPTCPVCADSMIAAEASAYLADNAISYLWTCDTCGYGFVTKHAVKSRFVCN
ncbi:hypothetical protein SSBR45G_05560 [Bradyrhizobium sp. SSBR45G]|nr:hypothetical protein SSBR45G_05560 [Bradyrhizobium sp. SSBR45G]